MSSAARASTSAFASAAARASSASSSATRASAASARASATSASAREAAASSSISSTRARRASFSSLKPSNPRTAASNHASVCSRSDTDLASAGASASTPASTSASARVDALVPDDAVRSASAFARTEAAMSATDATALNDRRSRSSSAAFGGERPAMRRRLRRRPRGALPAAGTGAGAFPEATARARVPA